MESIILKAKDLYKYVAELAKNETIHAIEVTIFDYENEDNITNKYLTMDIVECGGLGLTSNDESLIEMTKEEILDIP